MFSVLIDFDCQSDTSDIYENSWAVDFLNFYKNVKANGSRLMHLDVGQSFSLALTDDGRMFSWGLNDYCQLARKIDPRISHNQPGFCKVLSDISPRIIATGDEHTVMVDYANDVYVWGGNMAGQLGVGHSREPRTVIKLTSIGKNVKNIAARGRKNYLITNDGELLSWPNKSSTHKFVPCPVAILDRNVAFSHVSVGHNFAFALSNSGLLYGFGENKTGQLGLGDMRDRESFTLLESLKEYGEKATEISCGHQHSICKTASGKVFTWGAGDHGQLGIGVRNAANKPVLVKTGEANIKTKSVQAGYLSSYILLENRKIYHAGALSSTNSNNISFKPFNYEHKVRSCLL
jgi:alpha-tubulin suppressor-like RCC1 family protein